MTDTSAQDPEAIRAQIERTRSELGSDVDALADKVTPSKIVDREKTKAKNAIGSVRDKVFGVASDVSSSVSGAGHSVADRASAAGGAVGDLPHRAVAGAQGNAIAVGLIAFGAGLLAASLIPASEKEKEIASGVKEAAQPLMEQAQDLGKEVAGNLQEPAMNAATAVRDEATGAAQNIREEATGAAQDVKDEASNAKHAVQDQATS